MDDTPEGASNLKDGREHGNWQSRYTCRAWAQVVVEFLLLVFYLFTANYFLLDAIIEKTAGLSRAGFIYCSIFDIHILVESAKWIALALAGFIGGAVFDLKWLYHSVARGTWNTDRWLWRIIVPFNSAMVSLFTGFLVASEAIPFLKSESFENVYALLGFGFLFGYFSDNILAALQNLAKQTFGTLKDG